MAVALLVVVLVFPKLTALLVAGLVRLALRGCVTLAGALVKELVWQATSLFGELEEAMIAWLGDQLGLQGTSSSSVPLTMSLPDGTSQHRHYEHAAQVAHPTRPLDIVIWVLLAYNAYLQRLRGGAGEH